ncbi:hypothetical protein O7634_19510 [Micromonospora sp. WMMD1120]|uniref:hypothetical protein n=1 Tax=Micromonospora sp. WMMD1120 TaxID=3016106 RepID=UPI0024166F14|nr:hypothetical protein [Micromonospora sp. WMMD1120]MDG4808940.1 hypothetical protein [Micromonospora sp. WMMD1120]
MPQGPEKGNSTLDEEILEAERQLANLSDTSDDDALTDDDARAPDDAPSEQNAD